MGAVNYPEVNLNSTHKKKKIRKQIMNSSYISGNLASSSVTSDSRPKFKKVAKDAAQDKKQNSQKNSYSYLTKKPARATPA